jgi:hypothetical protein
VCDPGAQLAAGTVLYESEEICLQVMAVQTHWCEFNAPFLQQKKSVAVNTDWKMAG